ncbi:MAG: DNA repair protein RecN [Acidimicrobiaceae bacterium]|nr:DNA repair protein RecN [Acidimicrobiaceae bacterium]
MRPRRIRVLLELQVTDLGVVEELSLVLEPGLTAVTGETGAGKTMVVTALDLLMGGRADPGMVRPGADEAVVAGRFVVPAGDGGSGRSGEQEVVFRRVVPREGRSRAYLDGDLATATALAERGVGLVDLHGQHAHQSLLAAPVQRAALDRFGGVDLAALSAAEDELAAVDVELAAMGGDERARAREIDLLRFQVAELEEAGLEDPAEDDLLAAEEALLADASAHREAAEGALVLLDGDGPASESLASALGLLAGRTPFAGEADRLEGLAAEVADVAARLRNVAESVEEDPARLEAVMERRRLLAELRRKYGNGLEDVLAYHREAAGRLSALLDHDARAATLDARRVAVEAARREAAATVLAARRRAAPELASRIEAHLRELAMPAASVEVEVRGESGQDVALLLATNSGATPAPLAKVASGGELARAMLAVRRVVSESPPTLVFDEVDAGVGGTAAHAVAAALAGLAGDRQVLVVTHLAQVAACADQQLAVEKVDDGVSARATIRRLGHEERIVEVSRMLSGSPDSATARDHAAELLGGLPSTAS